MSTKPATFLLTAILLAGTLVVVPAAAASSVNVAGTCVLYAVGKCVVSSDPSCRLYVWPYCVIYF